MRKQYDYIIDLNERGYFNAHVENSKTGKVVTSFSNENERIDDEGNIYTEYGEIWLVEDGYMKNINDVNGLYEYLVEMEVIEKDAELNFVG
jgi:hypothetical protein